MLAKILVIVLAFAGNFIVQWYGNFSGKLSSKGTYLGMPYDSVLVRSVVTQLEYLWVLIVINILFTAMFHIGFTSFKSFVTLALIWLAMGPISALVLNAIVLKEKVSLVAIVGMFLIIVGGVFVVAQKEITALFTK